MFAREFHRAHVVGLDFEFVLAGDFAQTFEVGLAFEQYLRGEDDFFAAVGEVFGQAVPVGKTHFLAARADDFAEIDGVDRGVEQAGVKFEQGFFLPEKKDGAEGEFHRVHRCLFLYFHGRLYAPRVVWWPSDTLLNALSHAGLILKRAGSAAAASSA